MSNKPDTGSAAATQLLLASGDGDRQALDEMTALVYDELHSLAAAFLAAERPGHTLQPTALVHEVYLRLINQRQVTPDFCGESLSRPQDARHTSQGVGL